MSTALTAHQLTNLAAKGKEYSDRLGLSGAHEGALLVMLEQGHDLVSAEAAAASACLQGRKMPMLSKTCREAMKSVIEATWQSMALMAQHRLLEIVNTSANEKNRLDAAKTILDRAGHGAIQKTDAAERKGKTMEELMAELEELRQITGA